MAAPKATAKTTTAKKAAAPKAAAKEASKKTAKAAKPAKPSKSSLQVKERFTKTTLLTHLAESTELSKKQVLAVLDNLGQVIDAHIGKKGPGEFVLPGLLKISTVKKPAKKARKGINPFTGEETTFKAKPASVAVKIRPLKKLKAAAE